MGLTKERLPPSGTPFRKVVSSLQKKVQYAPKTRSFVAIPKRAVIDRYHLYVSYACREYQPSRRETTG